jgi:hypothetical protein
MFGKPCLNLNATPDSLPDVDVTLHNNNSSNQMEHGSFIEQKACIRWDIP